MPYLLHQLLTESARRDPQATAAVCQDRSIAYGDLDAASDRLAGVLAAGGVRRGDRVGFCLNKSIESVIAIFGILKAGAAYVPLDPGAPVKRIGYIVGDSGMTALVGQTRKLMSLGAELAPDGHAVGCVVHTDDAPAPDLGALGTAHRVAWSAVLQAQAGPPDVAPIATDLAYVLYTSGSTGEPKGVMIAHRTSLTFIDWAHATFGVRADDRLSSHAPFHFDLSIFDIFVTIKAGATLVLIPEMLAIFPRNLAELIEQQRISVWYSVPSALTSLVLNGEMERFEFSPLRTILFAGEVFPVKYLRQLHERIPHARYFNLYGPTETNVCTWYEVEGVPPSRVEPFPIGKACANTEVFAVDENDRLCKPGETGELLVSGPGVAQGYWGLPERTAQAFGPHPLRPGGEVYRTGDLVRRDENSDYFFVGRRDNQIKSRGYRVELGEIETALYAHPELQEVAVVAIPDDEIGNQIKAIAVRSGGSALTRRELEAYCAERVPKYMVPGIVEFRETLPKTSTGKVDKPTLVREHLDAASV